MYVPALRPDFALILKSLFIASIPIVGCVSPMISNFSLPVTVTLVIFDPPIKKTQAIGKTIFHIPYLGKAILFVQSPIGLASVLAVLIGLKVMYSLIRTKQEDLEL